MKSILVLLAFVVVLEASLQVQFKILERDSPSKPANYDLAKQIKAALASNSLNVPWKVLNSSLYYNGTATSANEESSNSAHSLRFSNALFAILGACVLFTSGFQRTAFLMVIFGVLLNCGAFALTRNYDHCKLLDEGSQFKLHWKITSNLISIGVEAQSQGWAAIGLSRNGQMNSGGVLPSDIMMGYRGANFPNGVVSDYSTKFYDLPVYDTIQNVDYVSSAFENGVLTLEWDRLLSTGDVPADLDITPGQAQYVLFAKSDTVPLNQTTFTKHVTKGSFLHDFGQPSECPTGVNEIVVDLTLNTTLDNFDSDAFVSDISKQFGIDDYRVVVLSTVEDDPPFCPECHVVEFRYPNYQIPADDTTYACTGFVFPWEMGSQHIIKFEAILDKSELVHHMLLYQMPAGLPAYNNGSSDVILCNMAPKTALPLYAWAPGGAPVVPPSDVGFRVGGSNGVKYAVLQIHYNNPTAISGVRDSSGVRMYMTNKTRPYDGGFIFLGLSPSKTGVPGLESTWHQSGSCLAMTTINYPQLNVFANMNHMHRLGVKQWTEQYRGGQYIGNLGEIMNWDFNSQKFTPLNGTVLPGDELITHCIWDTSTKANYTEGGEATQNEMCVNALLYYPIIPVEVCWPSNTNGCRCDYGADCLHTPACNRPNEGYCGDHKDCSSCSADPNCGWCDSGAVSTCINTKIYTNNYCQTQLKGVQNQCSTIPATCSSSHSSCAACTGDTANGCTWCTFTEFSSLSNVCANSTAACTLLGGWAKSTC